MASGGFLNASNHWYIVLCRHSLMVFCDSGCDLLDLCWGGRLELSQDSSPFLPLGFPLQWLSPVGAHSCIISPICMHLLPFILTLPGAEI